MTNPSPFSNNTIQFWGWYKYFIIKTKPNVFFHSLHHCYHLFILLIYLFCFFLRPHLRYMEVPRLGVQSELQLPAYTTATATPDPSHICALHHSSQQCQVLNPLSFEARDWTWNLLVPNRICFCCAMTGTLLSFISLIHKLKSLNILLLYYSEPNVSDRSRIRKISFIFPSFILFLVLLLSLRRSTFLMYIIFLLS